MTSLREAIENVKAPNGLIVPPAVVPHVLAVVEAHLREHDRELLQAFLDNGVYAERWKVDERERARQRIEALPRYATKAREHERMVYLPDVLEALRGSDE